MTKKHVPAKRYDLFITAFEKKVAEAQERISAMNALQGPYSIVREILELADLPNDINLDMTEAGISVRIPVKDDQPFIIFENLARRIGKELHAAGHHQDGIPSCRNVYVDSYFEFRLNAAAHIAAGRAPPLISIHIDVPFSGTNLVEVTFTEELKTYVDRRYEATWHTEPFKRHSLEAES